MTGHRFVSLLLTLALLATPALAIRMAEEPTLPELVARATVVVHGTVERAEAAWAEDEWGRHIWTTYTIRVHTPLKGDPEQEVVTFRVMGGSVGDRSELVFDIPRPVPGQEAIHILSASAVGPELAFERSLPVENGEVRVGPARLPLGPFVTAVQELVRGDERPLERLTTPRAVAFQVAPTGPGDEPHPFGQVTARAQADPSPAPTATATIYEASWSDGVDNNSNGYYQSAHLNFDADVVGGGTLTVFAKIWYTVTGTSNWQLGLTTNAWTITNDSQADAVYVIVGNIPRNRYDIGIEIYRQGTSTPDAVRGPTEDSDLSNLPFETAAEDGGGGGPTPVVTSVSPAKASAGTNTKVTITGTGFGTSRGQVKFTFRSDADDPLVAADISSWTDTKIECTVPICRAAQGECGGYPGGASSGPMWVYTAGGTRSDAKAFEVTFSYGEQKWNPAQVNYRIGTGVPAEFKAAIERAFATWAAAGNIKFTYSGTSSGTQPSNNGTTELFYGPMPSGTPEGVIAFANCWPQTAATVTECDILFNSALNWSTAATTPANYFDLETIALHEFGHWLVLDDLYGRDPGYASDQAKVMFGLSSTGSAWTKRALHTEDVNGIRWIYGSPSTCTTSITPTSRDHTSAAGSGAVSVTAGAGCTWQASSNSTSWLSVTGGSSGSGNGTVTYSYTANTGAARSGTLTVADKTFTVNQAAGGGTTTCTYSYWVPVAARQAGSGGTNWRSDLGLLNTGTGSASIEVRGYTGTTTLKKSVTLAANNQEILRDLLNWMQSGFDGQASVQVCSSQPLQVMSRTYTQEATGKTFGQGYDGIVATDTLGTGQTAVLSMLTQNGEAGVVGTYRTNIGLVNTGTGSASVTLTLFDNAGTQVWSNTRTLASGEKYQYNTPYKTAGKANLAKGWARVKVDSGSGVFAYASVLDNGSADPTTINMKR